jgi:hypothetical protein
MTRNQGIPNVHFLLKENYGAASQESADPCYHQDSELNPSNFTLATCAECASIQKDDGGGENQQ